MTHFIKLPDGTIINTARVRRVTRPIPNFVYIDTGQTIDENQDNPSDYHDPTGAIYAYFDNIATAIVAAEEPTDDDNELGW